MLSAVMEKADNIQEQMGDGGREMETLKIKRNDRNKEDSNRNEE